MILAELKRYKNAKILMHVGEYCFVGGTLLPRHDQKVLRKVNAAFTKAIPCAFRMPCRSVTSEILLEGVIRLQNQRGCIAVLGEMVSARSDSVAIVGGDGEP